MESFPQVRDEIVELARAYLARSLAVATGRANASNTAFAVTLEEAARVVAPPTTPPSVPAELAARITTAQRALTAALAAPVEPLLARLARVCWLTELDVVIVAILLAPEL